MTSTANPDSTSSPLCGLVMAGGRSHRMGAEKATIDYNGKQQIRYEADLLGEALDGAVYASVRPGQSADFDLGGVPVIDDRYADAGPMSGILTALEIHPNTAWLALACDLPLVNSETIQLLSGERDATRMATAFMGSDGFFEPLFAIYEPAIAPLLRERMTEKRFSLRDVLADCDVRMVCIPDDSILLNVNTPEDAARAKTIIDSGGQFQ